MLSYRSAIVFLLCLFALPLVPKALARDEGLSSSVTSTEKSLIAEPKARLKIALVLSGGGARGGAHVGVLKVLEEKHIPIDFIVGTSAGAIVGAAYASGMKVDEIDTLMSGLRTVDLFTDIDRAEVPLRYRPSNMENHVDIEIGVGKKGIKLPKGAVSGVSLEAVLRRLTSHQQSRDFDKLPIPFRAVATDLVSAKMVVLDHGDLSQAIRASMAIPALVTPVELQGHLLVDGGLTRNLPVDVARSMGADIIIAVNIGTPMLKREEINSVLSVSEQISNIMTNRNVEQSIKELTPKDILITPDLKDITSADFDRLSEAIQTGVIAANKHSQELARYSISSEQYAAVQLARTASIPTLVQRIDTVRVTGTHYVNPQTILSAVQSKEGDAFDPIQADKDVKNIYAMGDFERVDYSWTQDPNDGHILTAQVVEKSWGPNYLNFGLGLSTDFENNSYFQLSVSQRWKWLNSLGGEWRNDLQTGRNDFFRSEFYQPLNSSQKIFAAAHVEWARDPFDIYENGQRLARYRRQSYDVGADAGITLWPSSELRFGVIRGRVNVLTDTSPLVDVDALPKANTGGFLVRGRVDTLDKASFPTKGFMGDATLYASTHAMGATDEYSRVSARFNSAFTYGRHTLQMGGQLAKGLGNHDLPKYELFSLGGFLQLSGYKTGEFLGSGLVFGRLMYNYKLFSNPLFEGVYLGGSLELGKIGDSVYKIQSHTPWMHGGSVYVAADTLLGPIYLGYGRANSKNQALYLLLGRPF